MEFYKYQGTGNDFILIDIRGKQIPDLDVAALCHRRFGIGADGLMYLAEKPGYDFEMIYYNSDGKTSSMCGNGGRCIAAFAHFLGLGNQGVLRFLATDGPHTATVGESATLLGMKDVSSFEVRGDDVYVLDTGSPHYVKFIDVPPQNFDLIAFAKGVRYGQEFNQNGINVNIVQIIDKDSISMRTYERGVEDETYSCGTGVTAAALAFQLKSGSAIGEIAISTPGGNLKVHSQKVATGFKDIILEGPAVMVFKGTI